MERLAAFLRRPEGAIAIYAVVTITATLAAYYALFSQFASYNDEGTVLLTLKSFVGGETLYRDVYTPFGPFYFELFGGLFAGFGWEVTTEASRTIVLLIWVGSSLLLGFAVQRLTRQLALGVTAMLVASPWCSSSPRSRGTHRFSPCSCFRWSPSWSPAPAG
jgi:hypothetical protein